MLLGLFCALSHAYEAPPAGFAWKKIAEIQDNTHRHITYELRYHGRKVVDAHLKEHFNRDGHLESSNSSFDKFFWLSLPRTSSLEYWKETYGVTLLYESGPYEPRIRGTSVIWIHPETKQPVAALEMLLHYPNSLIPRKIIIDEISGRLLEEKNTVRAASTTAYVYPISPIPNGVTTAPTSVTIDYLDNLTSLKNSNIWVRREEVTSYNPLSNPALVTATVDVIPTTDFTASGSFNTPYADATSFLDTSSGLTSCTGTGAQCPDQGIDSVNVYYHLMNFRKRIDAYLTTLGSSLSFPSEPLNVLINPVSLTLGANNAMYIDSECADGMERCLLFIRPAALSSKSAQDNCGTSSATLYDFAREAVVVTHEYQHYITDIITHIGFSGGTSVGDALHEGYSDYFGASYVSDHNSTDVTLVGDYSLSECTLLQRELNTLRVYENSAAESDPHTSGLSWASGLWNLRTQFGATKADLIALKSLFFLSTSPGFVESVEALVKADEALYNGEHAAYIRDLFYNQIKWGGNISSAFKDAQNGIIEVGVKGCAAAHAPTNESPLALWITLAFSILLISFTIYLGRKARS
jgi:hypothetical protein